MAHFLVFSTYIFFRSGRPSFYRSDLNVNLEARPTGFKFPKIPQIWGHKLNNKINTR